MDELRLSQNLGGRGGAAAREPRRRRDRRAIQSCAGSSDLVLQERRSLRDIGLASFTISVLTIFPPLLVMAMVNKVLQFHSVSTLVLLSRDHGDRLRL